MSKMEQERSKVCIARQTTTEALKDMSPQKQDGGAALRSRDTVEVKAFWEDVRGKLRIDDEEVYPEDTETASELPVVSDGDPFGNGPFGDGKRIASAFRRIVIQPLTVVTGPEDPASEYTQDSDTDWTSDFDFDWKSDNDREGQRSDGDSINGDGQGDGATTPSPPKERQQGRVDGQHPPPGETFPVAGDGVVERNQTEAETEEVAGTPPTKQTNGISAKSMKPRPQPWPKSGLQGSKKMWGKIKRMVGARKSTAW